MSDPVFVAAAYTIVLGGLTLYAASLVRRLRAARRTAEALERERARDRGHTAATVPPGSGPVETPR
jgi:hypothetical protein